MSTRKDKAYLRHILDAISDIKRFMKDLTKEEFFENKEKQYAVLRALEIIGEATKNLSKELKAEHPEVQWSDIITKGCRGLQNRRISLLRNDNLWLFGCFRVEIFMAIF